MSKKSRKVQQQAKTLDTVQWVAIGVIAVVILALVWVAWPKGGNFANVTPPAKTGEKQYASAPEMMIDTNKQFFATVTMEKGGSFVIELYAKKAPLTVNSFVFLAREGYFNGITFHRVLEGFMAQGGDPTGSGMGGPGYAFKDEPNDLVFDKPGILAMANSGPDTNGSQFFITFAPTEFLNGRHTIFGQVIEGMDVVNAITRRDPEQNPGFLGDAIKTVEITEK